MKKNLKKMFAFLLSFVLITCSLPMQSLATDKVQKSTEAAVIADVDVDKLAVVGEVEKLRDENTKVYELEDGTYFEVRSALPLHTKKLNKWKETTSVETPKTVQDISGTVTKIVANEMPRSSGHTTNEEGGITTDTNHNWNEIKFEFAPYDEDGWDADDYTFINNQNGLVLKDTTIPDGQPTESNPDGTPKDTNELTLSYKVGLITYELDENLQNEITVDSSVLMYPLSVPYGYSEQRPVLDGNGNPTINPSTGLPQTETYYYSYFDEYNPTGDVNADVLDIVKVDEENTYYFDATDYYNNVTNGIATNNGLFFFGRNADKIGISDLFTVRRYRLLSALKHDITYHTIDVGLAGSLVIDDYSNNYTLMRNEIGFFSTLNEINILRAIGNTTFGECAAYGNNAGINYHSRVINPNSDGNYTWNSIKGESVTFEVTNTSSYTSDRDGLGYSINVSSRKIKDANNTLYSFNSSWYLTSIKDVYNNNITITYSTGADKHITRIDDALNKRRYEFDYTNTNFSVDGISVSRNLLTSITLKQQVGRPYNVVKIDGVDAKITFNYTPVTSNLIMLTKATYPDNSFVTYSYNQVGELTKITDVDGRNVRLKYDPNISTYSLYRDGETYTSNYTDVEVDHDTIRKTDEAANYHLFTGYDEYVKNKENPQGNDLFKSSMTISNEVSKERKFTDQDGKVVSTSFNDDIKPECYIDDNGNTYMFDYSSTDVIATKINNHSTADNMCINGDFSDDIDGWEASNYDTITSATLTDCLDQDRDVLKIEGDLEEEAVAYQIIELDTLPEDTDLILDVTAFLNSASTSPAFTGIRVYPCDSSGDVEEGELPMLELPLGNVGPYVEEHKCVSFSPNLAEYILVQIVYSEQINPAFIDEISIVPDSDLVETINLSDTAPTAQQNVFYTRNSVGLPTERIICNGTNHMVEKFDYDSNAAYGVSTYTDFNNLVTEYSYDKSLGLLNSKTKGNVETEYEYNPLGLLKAVDTIVDGVTNNPVEFNKQIGYSYNKITSVTDNNIEYNINYDSFGNIKSINMRDTNTPNSTPVTLIDKSVSNGLVGSISFANGSTVSYTRNSSNKVSKIYYQGASDSSSHELVEYKYSNSTGELTEIKYSESDRIISVGSHDSYSVERTGSDNSLMPAYTLYSEQKTATGSNSRLFDYRYNTREETDSPVNGVTTKTISTDLYVDETEAGMTYTAGGETHNSLPEIHSDSCSSLEVESKKDYFGRALSVESKYTPDGSSNIFSIKNDYAYSNNYASVSNSNIPPGSSGTTNLLSSYTTRTNSPDNISTHPNPDPNGIAQYNLTFSYEYYPNNLVKAIMMHDANSPIQNNETLVSYYEYDSLGQMTLQYDMSLNQLVLYQYDGNGNIIQKDTYSGNNLSVQYTGGAFTYNVSNAYPYKRIKYQYDSTNVNLLVSYKEYNVVLENGVENEQDEVVTTLNNDANGNVRNYHAYTYDGSAIDAQFTWKGNLLEKLTSSSTECEYFYDDEDNLIQIKFYNSSHAITSSREYIWKDGRLDGMVLLSYQDNHPHDATTIKYLYDDMNNVIGFVPHFRNYFPEDGDEQDPLIDSEEVFWCINNGRGDIVALYNGEADIMIGLSSNAEGDIRNVSLTGDCLARMREMIAGQVPSSVVDLLVSFTTVMLIGTGMSYLPKSSTAVYDVSTGCIFEKGRVYSPFLSRYINSDPESVIENLSDPLATNQYTFAYNNPVNLDSEHKSLLDKNSVQFSEIKTTLWMKDYFD